MFQITLHVAYVHAFVNPTLFLVLHRGLRQAALDLCCGCCTQWTTWLLNMTSSNSSSTGIAAPPTLLPPPPQPPATSLGDISLLKPPLPPANNKLQLVNRTYMWVVCRNAPCMCTLDACSPTSVSVSPRAHIRHMTNVFQLATMMSWRALVHVTT